jgi:hypothetical protein
VATPGEEKVMKAKKARRSEVDVAETRLLQRVADYALFPNEKMDCF